MGETYNIDCECIPRIAAGLGGGVARQGEACGALTGSVLSIGLLLGPDDAGDDLAKAIVYDKCIEFTRRFAKASGGVRCRELTGIDMSNKEGLKEFRERQLQNTLCTGIVTSAVELLEELLEKPHTEPD